MLNESSCFLGTKCCAHALLIVTSLSSHCKPLRRQFACAVFGNKFCLFLYIWLCRVFADVCTLASSSCDAQASHRSGFSRCRTQALGHVGFSSRNMGSEVVVLGLSCSAACGIFPDQGSNPCPLHWQVDSLPLSHQGSLLVQFLKNQGTKV